MPDFSDKTYMASIALEQLPKVIRQTLLNNTEFTKEYGITTDSEIRFGEQGPSFSRNSFYDALQKLFSGSTSSLQINDDRKNQWSIDQFDEADGTFELKFGDQSFRVEGHWPLIEEADKRLACLNAEALNEKWPPSFKSKWYSAISGAKLDAKTFFEFFEDREALPYRVKERIVRILKAGGGAWSEFVPSDNQYFEVEFGSIGASRNLEEFAVKEFCDHCRVIVGDAPGKTLKKTLSLCWHQSFAQQVVHEELSEREIARSLIEIADTGSLVSRVSAIEFGLQNLEKHKFLDEAIERLISSVLAEDSDDPGGRFCLLAACIVLTGGLVSQRKIFCDSPVFYRRYIELAHATVLEDLVWNSSQKKADFFRQVVATFRQRYLAQGYADLIEAPRWIPEYLTPGQLKAEFVSRIRIALESFRDVAQDSKLSKFFDAENGSVLVEHVSFPHGYMPGPLEGSMECKTALPDGWSDEIHEALTSGDANVDSFVLLINTSLVFKPHKDHIEVAAKAIAEANFQLKLGEKNSYLSLLLGLSNLAALTNSSQLSENTLVLLKRTMNLGLESMAAEDIVRVVCLLAAVKSDKDEWAKELGHMFLWLSSHVADAGEASHYRSMIQDLCDINPKLWSHLGRAMAGFDIVVLA
ncbi:hypothetical protein [Ruegeria conchae]|uniref:hypothetical protein n=1 Tax=Ruegeria conchae TaxID=981384 RepID=UPI0029C73252|nr:hypothetical protein [Ruegeria conchae]